MDFGCDMECDVSKDLAATGTQIAGHQPQTLPNRSPRAQGNPA